MRPFSIVICGLSAAAGCLLSLNTNTQTIAITEPNELGVVTVEVEHYSADGNDVYALRAFTADSQERASVQLTRGTISGISNVLPGDDDIGAEIVVLVDGAGSRMVTRELERYRMDPSGIANPVVERFLELPEIAATLDHEANISLSPPNTEQPYATALPCWASILNTTPVAEECCAGSASQDLTTVFHKADQSIVIRNRNPHGTPCTAYDGSGACNGAACFYGPNAFAKPQLYQPTNTYAYIFGSAFSSYNGCAFSWGATDPTPIFPNVTGTFPTGQGCPNGASGAGLWDY